MQSQHKSLIFIAVSFALLFHCSAKNTQNNDFDNFVFSQRWLPTSCVAYIENHPGHHCALPNNYTYWAVHGLWPNRDHGGMGPFFCNSSMPFNLDLLKPIIPILTVYWPNIEREQDVQSLWKHEWEKHGTCAAVLDSLNTEYKYFNASLTLFNKYNMNKVFYENKIVPSNVEGYDVLDIFNIVKRTFGSNAYITCTTEVETQTAYLSEIRLCYSKNLELIDCKHSHRNKLNEKHSLKNTMTNCPVGSKVMLPKTVEPQPTDDSSMNAKLQSMVYYDTLLYYLKVIRLLQWITL